MFFEEQTVRSLNEAIDTFETMKFDAKEIQEHAQKFSKKNFQEGLLNFIAHHLPK
ncbi:MAG: hypothetical protein H6767_04690 [Candidatus Peribacteria bacterium]|nr:MAG: hypothetical protein H6767_04690 [Candidatus Peribacteria bacterium]